MADQRPIAAIVPGIRYDPDLDAWGLRHAIEGDPSSGVVPINDCPDVEPAKVMRDGRAHIDARIWEGQFDRRGHCIGHRVTDRLDRDGLNGHLTKLTEAMPAALREQFDYFAHGFNGPPMPGGGGDSYLTQNYTPLIPGPWTRQQYWADYWATSAKAFEASTHSGVAKRACRSKVQFTYGRGVRWEIKDDDARKLWERFWRTNRMRRRFRQILYDWSVFGEQMLRYFPAALDGPRLQPNPNGDMVIVRQIDPGTIYEIVTDQEDEETVYFYHQQFQTRMELYSPRAADIASGKPPEGKSTPGVTRYIIRQIPAHEIDHYKLNTVSGEVRGRSDLFPVLGDLKRLRDLMTSKVIQADIGNRVMAIVKANGTEADIQRVLGQIFPGGQPPPPGTIVGLNAQTDMAPFEYGAAGRSVRSDFTYDELIDQIAAGVDSTRMYLGLAPASGTGTTQATALTAVEPAIKAYEERQDMADEMLHEMFDRVMCAAGVNGEVDREFIFPEIATEDTSIRLANLEIAMSNNWLSHRTATESAATELGFTGFDYDTEMAKLVGEYEGAGDDDDQGLGPKPTRGGKVRRPMIRAQARQAPMLDPTKAPGPMEDEPPGLAVTGAGPTGDNAVGNGNGTGNTPPAALVQKNPASQGNNIRATAKRRGGKQTREANRREPDDPEFGEQARSYTRETRESLEQLFDDLGLPIT